MSEDRIARAAKTSAPFAREERLSRDTSENWHRESGRPALQNHRLFRALWLAVNGLLVLSMFLVMYTTGWEYSTRRYLTGFSDAIVPATAPVDQKIEAILNWMAHGPARRPSSPGELMSNRDPTDTLNYDALLRVCGTATNAFINLMETGHMQVRRLLLLDAHSLTKHVVAEVLADGRWIIVDPAFRVVPRSPDGKTLTREELSNPAIFTEATQGIAGYDPSYTFDHTTHIRVGRLGYFGTPLQRILDRLVPGWDASSLLTLLVERESLAALVTAVLLVIFLILLRIAVRWYGENRLGIRSTRIRGQLDRVCAALLDTGASDRNRVGGN
jgi:hypothetical protein